MSMGAAFRPLLALGLRGVAGRHAHTEFREPTLFSGKGPGTVDLLVPCGQPGHDLFSDPPGSF